MQTATVFKDGQKFESKPYKFKVQSVSPDGKRRKTFAKCTIDLAQYCHSSHNGTEEVVINME